MLAARICPTASAQRLAAGPPRQPHDPGPPRQPRHGRPRRRDPGQLLPVTIPQRQSRRDTHPPLSQKECNYSNRILELTLEQAAAGYRAMDERRAMDAPLINGHFASIEDVEEAQAQRCVALQAQPDLIRFTTLFRWWPQRLHKRHVSKRQ